MASERRLSAMPRTTRCPSCETVLNVPEAGVGRRLRCPKCSTKFFADDPGARVDLAYRLLFARPPTAEEARLALDFLGPDADGHPGRWAAYAQALLASNEFLFID